ncbi:hypothetical protein QUV83_02670 [Cellulomonas cellasea]|uniref:hypothetical protein n=1 Tax=Cellulomonas cellasea TaxID=43670 RepID=UPI0025A44454|nr:hypothetical protein [Cellulomonas cellasea]MDM8083667.1 hypothetical protein [Cellulomonas cellasea]
MTEHSERPMSKAPGEDLLDLLGSPGAAATTLPDGGAPAAVMGLLAEHVPLALLADLAAVDGPVSQAILESEGLPADEWWVDPGSATA